MGFEWTKEQRAVIDIGGCSTLVSAAAGSGKTAVLVERLIRLLTDDKHPVDIERLLVVTFTNAAAAEMRERIGRGLDRKLEAEPDSGRLRRQKLLLPYAQISTIHSLCLKMIREHFDVLDLDPSFRMGDEAELKLLKADIADDIMEIYYASGNKAFRDFVERYASGKTDKGIGEMIVRLYDYSRGFPWPKYWLERCCDMYENSWPAGEHPVIRYAMEQLQGLIKRLMPMLEEAKGFCLAENGPSAFLAVVQSDGQWLEDLEKAAETGDYEKARQILQTIAWKRLTRTAASVNPELKEAVKAIHTEVKAAVESLKKDFFGQSEEELRAEMAYLAPSIRMLTELADSFAERYQQEKLERNMLDFSDLEHYALKLLVHFHKNEDGSMGITPTSVAGELCQFYEEVVCDEYQDSNQVQEMILDVLSGEREGRFNRFMVGDVKQSIYRFRLADAAIFMDKYHRFTSWPGTGERVRIDLHQNFRSRASVLSGVNFFFRKLMTRDLGGISYDDQAALYPGMIYPEAGEHRVGERTELMLLLPDEQMDDDEKEEFSPVQLEAKAVAAKIKALTDPERGMDVYDGDLGGYRPAGYRDIVILLRTLSGWAETFVDILGQENIPVSAEMSEGFFDTMEIRTMTEFLSVVDNPGQDIPLTAVLKSPMVELTSEELALIRGNAPEGSMYAACRACVQEESRESEAEVDSPGEELMAESVFAEAGMDSPGAVPVEADTKEKLQNFLAMLKDIREAAAYMELPELLQYIYDVTGYYDYVQALPGGQRRRANLDLLMERAVTYMAGSYSGLFNFVRYIEQLKKNDIDFGEAALPEDGKGRVRLISIHKSKGLEYPIVILAGMGKKINFRDGMGSLVMHARYGLGMDAVNLGNRKKMVSVYKRFISRQINRDTLAEELRILYVAMTRAKEKLIITGMAGGKNLDEQLKDWYRMGSQTVEETSDSGVRQVLPDWALAGAKSCLDWLMPCLMGSDAMEAVMERRGLPLTHHGDEDSRLFEVRTVDIRELAGREVGRVMEKRYRREELLGRQPREGRTDGMSTDTAADMEEAAAAMVVTDAERATAVAASTDTAVDAEAAMVQNTAAAAETAVVLSRDENWQYAGLELLSLKGKYTVSELKKADGSEEAEALFQFKDAADDGLGAKAGAGSGECLAGEEDLTGGTEEGFESRTKEVDGQAGGASRGTAYHRVLELLDFAGCPAGEDEKWLEEQLTAMQAAGRLSWEQYEYIYLKDIQRMVYSDLGRRMAEADRQGLLKREAQFVMGIPACRVRPEIKSQELVVLQGVIDCFFEEDGRLVLVDYKTDRVPWKDGENILKERYSRQLDYYQYALEQMTGKKVTERILYSFALKRAVEA